MSLSLAFLAGLLLHPQMLPSNNALGTESEVRSFTPQTYRALLTERNGRALLVNVWATWCIPCVEEFPDLVALHKEYEQRGLDVVVVSIDYPDEVESKVKPFLRKMRAEMTAYVNAYEPAVDMIDAFDAEWNGAVPTTFTYSRSGSLVEKSVGRQSLRDFYRLADRALKAPR